MEEILKQITDNQQTVADLLIEMARPIIETQKLFAETAEELLKTALAPTSDSLQSSALRSLTANETGRICRQILEEEADRKARSRQPTVIHVAHFGGARNDD